MVESGHSTPPNSGDGVHKKNKLPRLVGNFIREKREALGLSQRALGQLFVPAVTTQFISNVERGVTPLPPTHVPTLSKALSVPEAEIMSVLEREYAVRLTGRLGIEGQSTDATLGQTRVSVAPEDFALMQAIYEAYRKASEDNQKSFIQACQNILRIHRGKPPEDGDPRKTPL